MLPIGRSLKITVSAVFRNDYPWQENFNITTLS